MIPLLVVMVVVLRIAGSGMAQYSMIPANARREKKKRWGDFVVPVVDSQRNPVQPLSLLF
jgi:hypothetical protein